MANKKLCQSVVLLSTLCLMTLTSCSWVSQIIPSWSGGQAEEDVFAGSVSKKSEIAAIPESAIPESNKTDAENSLRAVNKSQMPVSESSRSESLDRQSPTLNNSESGTSIKGLARIGRQNSVDKSVTTLEILWQVPAEPVEIYFLSYGLNPSALDKRVELPVSKLEKRDHQAYGPVFIYELTNLPPEAPVYFSLQAKNSYGISPPTPVVKVVPQT